MARRHWEAIGQGQKWRIFDALVLADADPDRPCPTREQLLGEFPGRDGQYLANCVLAVKRSIRALLPLLLPAEMSDRVTAAERFAEWKEILCDGQLTELNSLRWAVPVDWVQTATRYTPIASIGLAVDRQAHALAQSASFFDEDESGELPAEFEHDHLRVAQSVFLALPFAVYLEGPEPHSPKARGVSGQAPLEDTLQALLIRLGDGAPAEDPAALTARMQELKRYGKEIHHAATRLQENPTPAPAPPRELGQLLYTLASAVALVGAGRRIDSLEPRMLAGNLAWALKRPWLDPCLAPILQQAHARLVATSEAAG
jgi:hypothetical protein